MPTRQRARRRVPAPLSESLERLGERLRKARTEAGLSQAQVGAPHFTRAYVSALELGKIRPAMKSLEFLAAKLAKPVSYFVDDEEQTQKRRSRELALVRANQLIAQGSAREAIEEVSAIELEGLSTVERLTIKRTLGRAYVEAGQPGNAAALLGEVVRGYDALGDIEQSTRARAQLGAALIHLMSYAEADEHLQIALKAFASGVVRDPVLRVHVLHNLGVTHYQRGNYAAALEQFDRAAREGSDVGDQKWLASLYAAVGMARRQVGDYESAVTWLHKSEALFEALHNEARVAEIKFQMARTLWALGNRTRARTLLHEALAAAEAANNESAAIRIEAHDAWMDMQEEKHDAARDRLEQLLPRADRSSDPVARFAVRFALAKTLREAAPARSVELLRELASSLEAQAARRDLADVYAELSKVLGTQGRAEEALQYAQRAFAITATTKGGV